jgi:glycosyltransferase involved in cell wall biosynthesis
LRGLDRHHDITLLSFSERPDIDRESPEINSICQHVQIIPWSQRRQNKLQSMLSLMSPLPRSINDTFSPEMAQRIKKTLSEEKYDLIIASEFGTAIYSNYFHGFPAIVEDLEVGVLYEKFTQANSIWRKFRNGLTWEKHRRYIASLLNDFTFCTVVSERDKELLLRVIKNYDSLEVIPNFIDMADYTDIKATPEPNSLIFTGPFRYFANHDAMVWFLQEIYPQVQQQFPEVRLTITGDHANLPLPQASNVTLTGFVDDVRPIVASSWISLVPVREGAGTRLKILEAMAMGVPVVSTSKGAEGLEVNNGEHLLIADSAQDFADAVVRLLKEPEVRKDLVFRARKLIEMNYDTQAVVPKFENLVQRAGKNSSH